MRNSEIEGTLHPFQILVNMGIGIEVVVGICSHNI